jgi:hypothetical protein
MNELYILYYLISDRRFSIPSQIPVQQQIISQREEQYLTPDEILNEENIKINTDWEKMYKDIYIRFSVPLCFSFMTLPIVDNSV